MNITPEQALADLRAVRSDRGDSYWLECALALAKALDELSGERARLRAELDLYKATEARTIENSQKLRGDLANAKDHIERLRKDVVRLEQNEQVKPATHPLPPGIPPPPDGFVVAGWGREENEGDVVLKAMRFINPIEGWRLSKVDGTRENWLYALPPDSPHFDKFRPVSEGPR
jgi:hypothetical protein